MCILHIFCGLNAIHEFQILQNDISPTYLSLYAKIDYFSNVQIIFFCKEPAIELLHPKPAKVTIYLKITIASHSYSFKVSMMTYEFYCLFGLYGAKSLTLAILECNLNLRSISA